jgi:Uma2 family endonuclease
MAIARQAMSLEAFLTLPEEKPALEYFDGVVTQKVAPRYHHSALRTGLLLVLHRLTEDGRVARVLPELRWTYGRHSPVPDLSVYRPERIPRGPDGKPLDDFRVPPDLAIEILSPGETIRQLGDKCRAAVANGVAVALLVIPRSSTIRVFRFGAPVVVHRRGDRIALPEIGPGVALDVDEVFRPLDEG